MRTGSVAKAQHIHMSAEARAFGGYEHNSEFEAEHDSEPEEASEIEVILVRNEELVEAIKVVCPCGQRTEVECLYEALDTDGPPSEASAEPGENS